MANSDTCFMFCNEQIDSLTKAKVTCEYLEESSLYKDSIIESQKKIIKNKNLEAILQEEKYVIENSNHSVTKKKLKNQKIGSAIKQGVLIFIIGVMAVLSVTK